MNYKKKKKAFTLIELIIVIAILALLIAIALPRYQKSREKAAITSHNANVKILKTATEQYIAEQGDAIGDRTTLSADNLSEYLETIPKVPKGIPDLKATDYSITITSTGNSYDVKVEPEEIAEQVK